MAAAWRIQVVPAAAASAGRSPPAKCDLTAEARRAADPILLSSIQTHEFFTQLRGSGGDCCRVHPSRPDAAARHLNAGLLRGDQGVSFHFVPGATRASLSVPPNHQGNITAATFPPTVLQGSAFKSPGHQTNKQLHVSLQPKSKHFKLA